MTLQAANFSEENIAQGIYRETKIEDGFFILKFNNENDRVQLYKREVSSDFIQFHFCVKGSGSFSFNNGSYRLPIQEDTSLLLYNPERDLLSRLRLPQAHGCYRCYCR